MVDAPVKKAHQLIEHLEVQGNTGAAAKLRGAIAAADSGPVDKLLFALREFCLTILTAMESIDPATETLAEELRTEVDSHLRRHEAK